MPAAPPRPARSPRPSETSCHRTHMRCITTASLRASATLAFFMPCLLATRSAQALSPDKAPPRGSASRWPPRTAPCSTMASPTLLIRPVRSDVAGLGTSSVSGQSARPPPWTWRSGRGCPCRSVPAEPHSRHARRSREANSWIRGARRAGREGEVVGLERLERWEARRPCQYRPCPHAPGVPFGLEDLLQEVSVARVLPLRRALGEGAIEIGERAEPRSWASATMRSCWQGSSRDTSEHQFTPVRVAFDDHRLHVVVQHFRRRAAERQERPLVTADQRIHALVVAELDVGPPTPTPRSAMNTFSLSVPRPTVAQSACI